MKKYIIPAIKKVNVEVQRPLAESLGIKSGSINDESKVLSRKNDWGWDDDEDDY